MIKQLIAVAAVAAVAVPAQAVVVLDDVSDIYTQSFNSLSAAANNTVVTWANDSTLTGWGLFGSTGSAVTSYRVSDGGSNTGAIYSYGASGNSDRALGSAASGSFAGTIALAVTNSTGGALDSFTLHYDGEQWRNGGNTAAQSLTVQYGFGSSYSTVSWSAAGTAFTVPSLVNTGTAAAVAGNTAGLSANLGGTISTNWAAGDTLWVRWVDVNDAGNDHGLAIDNVTLSVTAVPEPGTYAMLLAGLASLGFLARRRRA